MLWTEARSPGGSRRSPPNSPLTSDDGVDGVCEDGGMGGGCEGGGSGVGGGSGAATLGGSGAACSAMTMSMESAAAEGMRGGEWISTATLGFGNPGFFLG